MLEFNAPWNIQLIWTHFDNIIWKIKKTSLPGLYSPKFFRCHSEILQKNDLFQIDKALCEGPVKFPWPGFNHSLWQKKDVNTTSTRSITIGHAIWECHQNVTFEFTKIVNQRVWKLKQGTVYQILIFFPNIIWNYIFLIVFPVWSNAV